MITLRPYQDEAVTQVIADLTGPSVQRTAVVLPTGGGKTVVFCELSRRWRRLGRTYVLVHRDELVAQTVESFRRADPDLKIGVVQGPRNELDRPVTVISVQSLARPSRLANLVDSLGVGQPLVIVDECHHATAATYRRVMEAIGCFGGRARALGVSATLARTDGASLGDIWQRISYRLDILDLIPRYLCDVRGRAVTVEGLDTSDVRLSGGDLAVSSLSEIMGTTDAAVIAARAYDEHGRRSDGSVRPGVVFAPSVATARRFTEAFRDVMPDVRTEMVWGAMGVVERRAILRAAREGGPAGVDIVINCMVLTEGTDVPRWEVGMIARPTASAPLYVQMAGRVLRLYPGKDQALLLDLVGAATDHRLATIADLSSRRIVSVGEGESLGSAAQRERSDRNPMLADYVVDSHEIDLFRSATRAAWLRTPAGVWFIAAGPRMVFLWPDGPGRYRVGERPLSGSGPRGGWKASGLDFTDAMGFAEQTARALWDQTGTGVDIISPRAAWRSRPARKPQLTMAGHLGIETEGLRAGALSDRINIALAAQALDSRVARITAKDERS